MKLATPTLLLDLFVAHHRSGQLVYLAVRDTGLTPDEYALLSFLRRSGPTTPTELARGLGLYLTTTLFRVGKLEERKLVTRAPNPNDGRSFIVSLTPRGNEKLDEAAAEFKVLLAGLERRLGDPSDVQETIVRLAEAIDAELAEAAAPPPTPAVNRGRQRRKAKPAATARGR